MKRPLCLNLALLFSFITLHSLTLLAQKPGPEAYDFWIGEWEVKWTKQDGSEATARNTITRILDGKVLQEEFRDSVNGYYGNSVSIYAAKDSTWHQTWVDNQGGHFEFYGVQDGENFIFRTQSQMIGQKERYLRMVFHDIQADSLIWDWELTLDGGHSWTQLWQLHYTRLK